MKAILEFNLPEDGCDFKLASHAVDWALVSWDMHNELRSHLKYGHKFKTPDEALESIRQFLWDKLAERGLSLDDIE